MINIFSVICVAATAILVFVNVCGFIGRAIERREVIRSIRAINKNIH